MRSTVATLLRVLNNNAVMVEAAGGRLILLGRGIGFSKQLGDDVLLSAATEVFQPSSPQELRQLADFVVEIPLETFQCGETCRGSRGSNRRSTTKPGPAPFDCRSPPLRGTARGEGDDNRFPTQMGDRPVVSPRG